MRIVSIATPEIAFGFHTHPKLLLRNSMRLKRKNG